MGRVQGRHAPRSPSHTYGAGSQYAQNARPRAEAPQVLSVNCRKALQARAVRRVGGLVGGDFGLKFSSYQCPWYILAPLSLRGLRAAAASARALRSAEPPVPELHCTNSRGYAYFSCHPWLIARPLSHSPLPTSLRPSTTKPSRGHCPLPLSLSLSLSLFLLPLSSFLRTGRVSYLFCLWRCFLCFLMSFFLAPLLSSSPSTP